MTALLQPKKPAKSKFSASISPALADDLRALEARIEAEAPDMRLDVDNVIEKALRAAVKKAGKELDDSKNTTGAAL